MEKNFLLALMMLLGSTVCNAQVGIGTESPHSSSLLDIESINKGILIPRMTTVERDAIETPAEGLQIYNITNNSTDVFSSGSWKSYLFSRESNIVYVNSLSDLPAPNGSTITLDETKMYVFSGFVDISPNQLLINGAGLRGTDPQKDIIASNISGAVLKSENKDVYIKELAVAPTSSSTQAYDFTGESSNFCNIFSGCSVVEIMGPSLGVGNISGFKAITIIQNYWKVTDGVKIGGTVGKFTSDLNNIVGISAGSGIEFLSNAIIDDVDISNNYFVYPGQTGIKVNTNASIDRGRLSTNLFRGVTNPLDGIDSYSFGWSMRQNTNIPDSRAFSYIFFNTNTQTTAIPSQDTFVKIAGTTEVIKQQRFTSTVNNRMTYHGEELITAKVFVVISAIAPKNNSNYSITISKNGLTPPATAPIASATGLSNNQSFQITLNTEIDMESGDYIEVFIRSNDGSDDITVNEMQFSATD
ncbi:hypothetical protein [Psychroflexus montanilacus]|uniref:hypothetical protein n=1 Tax=Psychroflexus montanilacus TaxID=2873598 RepID=UPI001CCA1362|nr:hypothetical protein [Psychroflexus montanilacus]MBZ9650936.1 hypothetical protein [Psychroflexus montanilacus]